MILVDTSIWVDHLRAADPRLVQVLNRDEVLIHPLVIGELSLGAMRNRTEIMRLLSKLPLAPVAEHDEVIATINKRRLFGTGIGWVDAHLIASALLARAGLMTRDKALLRVAKATGIAS